MAKKYTADKSGLRQLLKSSEMAQLVRDAAEVGADAARAAAPRGTGELGNSIHVEAAGSSGGPKGDRVEARVVADAPHAAAVQFGNARVKARPYLNAAIDAVHSPKGGRRG